MNLRKQAISENRQLYHQCFKALGKEADYLFQSVIYLGEASECVEWARTVAEEGAVPQEIKNDILQLNQSLNEVLNKVRDYHFQLNQK